MGDYDILDTMGLDLHHFYRAMAWLGEEIEEKSEEALAPRCVKDVIEEKMFDNRRDLFADLSAVFIALSDQVQHFFQPLAELSTPVLTPSTNPSTSVAVTGVRA